MGVKQVPLSPRAKRAFLEFREAIAKLRGVKLRSKENSASCIIDVEPCTTTEMHTAWRKIVEICVASRLRYALGVNVND